MDSKIDRSGLLPELKALLEAVDEGGTPSLDQMTPLEGRATSERDIPGLWGALETVAHIIDLRLETPAATLPARLYRAEGAKGTVLFFHGGGWVLGSLDTHDGGCRMLANATPCNVLSVEYRKGPEHPFPAAVIDVDASLDWLLQHGPALGLDISAIIVGGESAGGNLAAVLARHARDHGIALAGQVLICPVTDLSMDTHSYDLFQSGFNLTRAGMQWFARHYLPEGADRTHPDAAPLRAADLSGLAPAMIATMSFDPLRDEGRAYAARLVGAGNAVDFYEQQGSIHGVWVMNAVTPATGELIARAAAWINRRWS